MRFGFKQVFERKIFFARLGGDEFAVIAHINSIEDIEIITEKLLYNLSRSYKILTHDIIVSVSIGIANYPESGTDYVALRKNADIALYKAKEAGCNSYKYFNTKST